eukprot:scaffold11423_cov123-Isochrysis_galbana.AAC.11
MPRTQPEPVGWRLQPARCASHPCPSPHRNGLRAMVWFGYLQPVTVDANRQHQQGGERERHATNSQQAAGANRP